MDFVKNIKTNIWFLNIMSRINRTYESFKARKFFSFRYFSFYDQMQFHA